VVFVQGWSYWLAKKKADYKGVVNKVYNEDYKRFCNEDLQMFCNEVFKKSVQSVQKGFVMKTTKGFVIKCTKGFVMRCSKEAYKVYKRFCKGLLQMFCNEVYKKSLQSV
jgi:hypothetical protein